MRVDVVTIFPAMFRGPLDESILRRARDAGLLDVRIHDLRDFATDRHRTTDDAPYGGGAGMVMRPEPLFAAVESITADATEPVTTILLTPQGRVFNQAIALELSQLSRFTLLCGRYEGFDERVREHLATDQISLGDFVLTGGEIAALAIIDATTRLLPGALGSAESTTVESHAAGLLEYPQYTRPPEFRGWTIPDVLVSGNHAAIDRWRREQSLLRTLRQRPDLLAVADLTSADRRFLASLGASEYLRPEDVAKSRRLRRSPRRDADDQVDRER